MDCLEDDRNPKFEKKPISPLLWPLESNGLVRNWEENFPEPPGRSREVIEPSRPLTRDSAVNEINLAIKCKEKKMSVLLRPDTQIFLRSLAASQSLMAHTRNFDNNFVFHTRKKLSTIF